MHVDWMSRDSFMNTEHIYLNLIIMLCVHSYESMYNSEYDHSTPFRFQLDKHRNTILSHAIY